MNKKRVIVLIVLVLFGLFMFNSFAEEDSIENLEEHLIENITTESRAIPESVKKALMDYIEAKKIDEEIQRAKEVELQKKEKTDRILAIAASILGLIGLIYLFKKSGFSRRISRFYRRQILYHHIIKLSRKGLGGREILRVLQIKGYKRKHIDDSITRFKSMLRNKGVPSKLELWSKDRNVRGVIRRTRRQYIYFRIRLYRFFGKSIKEAGEILIKKGWKPLYVNDAVYQYKTYVEGRKNIFSKFLSWIFGASFFHKIKRSLRRKALYKEIRKFKKKRFPHSKIVSELVKQGYHEKHIKDAYYRYNRNRDGALNLPEDEFSLTNIWPIRPIRRKIRRQVLYSKISKLKKFGNNDEKIISTLIKQGHNEKHIIDSLYLYNVYKEIKKKNK